MIVHAQIFSTRYRTSMADYTLPYSRMDLDMDFIAKKCEKVCQCLDTFDDKLHQMDSKETKGLFYFFRYVKKNLFLITALEIIPGQYESQVEDQFVRFHTLIDKCARKNYKDKNKLIRCLTQ